jgi:hypothetical protein
MLDRQFDQLAPMEVEKGRGHRGETIRTLIDAFGERAAELVGIADLDDQSFESKRACRRLSIRQSGSSHGRIMDASTRRTLARYKLHSILRDFRRFAQFCYLLGRRVRLNNSPGMQLHEQ